MKMVEVIWPHNQTGEWIGNLPVPVLTKGIIDEDVEIEAEVVLLRVEYIVTSNPEGLIGDLGFSEHILDYIRFGEP